MIPAGKHRVFAIALAGVGHAVLFSAFFSLRIKQPETAAEPEVECEIAVDAGDAADGEKSAGAPAPGTQAQRTTAAVDPSPAIPPPATPQAPSVTEVAKKPPPPPKPAEILTPPPAPVTPTAPTAKPAAPTATSAAAPVSEKTAPSSVGATSGSNTGTGVGKTGAQGAGSGKTGSGAGHADGNLLAPRYRRKVDPEYPARARRLGLEGEVVLRIHLSPAGAATAVDIQKSSGSRLLDEAARDAALESEYEPARQDGRAVPSAATASVSFKLDR